GTVASSENDASPSICSIASPASAAALSTASQARLHSPRSPMPPQRVYGVSPMPTIQACPFASAIARPFNGGNVKTVHNSDTVMAEPFHVLDYLSVDWIPAFAGMTTSPSCPRRRAPRKIHARNYAHTSDNVK